MTTALERNGNVRYRARDPLALARSFFGFDPFFGIEARPAKSAFLPAFEIKETEEGYELRADLPGVKESDLDISLQGNVLTVGGDKAADGAGAKRVKEGATP